MASVFFNSFFVDLLGGNIDFDTDTIKIMLTNGYSPNIDSHNRRDDVTNEVSASGYTAGGVTLTSPTLTQDNTNDLGKFDAADVSIAANITADGAVIYKSTGTAANDPLVCFIDFGSASTGNPFQIQFSASGILTAEQG